MSKARQLADLGNVYDDGALSNRNLIINGAMQVAQRGTSFTGLTSDVYTLDRWYSWHGDGSTTSMEQSTEVPSSEFSYSLKRTVTTANTSTATNLQNGFEQRIEGYDINRLQWGTSHAKSAVLSFWVRSSIAGNYSIMMRNGGNDRYFVQNYTINSADVWQYVTIQITPETSGTWYKGTGKGLEILWNLANGSDFDDGVNGSWVTTNERFDGTTGQVNWINTLGATFYITGVQLEVGDTATPFEHRSYGDELARCQRYFWKLATGVNIGSARKSDTESRVRFDFPTQMRSSPTVTFTHSGSAGSGGDSEVSHVHSFELSHNGDSNNSWSLNAATADAEL